MVYILTVYGKETIKDVDSDFAEFEYPARVSAYNSRPAADEVKEFVKEVFNQVLYLAENLNYIRHDDGLFEDYRDEVIEAIRSTFKGKYEDRTVHDTSRWEILEVVLGNINSWSENIDELLNGIRVDVVETTVH